MTSRVTGTTYAAAPAKDWRILWFSIIGVLAVVAGILVVKLLLVTPRGYVSVVTQPAGASVYSKGALVGITPLSDFEMDAGPLTMNIAKEGYQRLDTNVSVGEDQTFLLNVLLKPVTLAAEGNKVDESIDSSQPESTENVDPTPAALVGTLIVRAVPSGSVLVDGKSVLNSATQFTSMDVPAGSRTLTFRHPRFGEKSVSVRVGAGERVKYSCFFERPVGIVSDPVWGSIVINGIERNDRTPKELMLPPGSYRISITRAGYETLGGEKTVSVEPIILKGDDPENKTYSVSFDLIKQ